MGRRDGHSRADPNGRGPDARRRSSGIRPALVLRPPQRQAGTGCRSRPPARNGHDRRIGACRFRHRPEVSRPHGVRRESCRGTPGWRSSELVPALQATDLPAGDRPTRPSCDEAATGARIGRRSGEGGDQVLASRPGPESFSVVRPVMGVQPVLIGQECQPQGRMLGAAELAVFPVELP